MYTHTWNPFTHNEDIGATQMQLYQYAVLFVSCSTHNTNANKFLVATDLIQSTPKNINLMVPATHAQKSK